MDTLLACVLVGLFVLMIVIAFWAILSQRKLAKYLPFLLVLMLIPTTFAQMEDADGIVLVDTRPLIVPDLAKAGNALMEDLLWLTGAQAFLGNDSLNLTNTTGLYRA